MNAQTRAVFPTNTPSRETRNDYPAPISKRATRADAEWRAYMLALRDQVDADTAELNRF